MLVDTVLALMSNHLSLKVVLYIGTALALFCHALTRKRVYPPGPKGFPFIGNLLQVPVGHPWLQYSSWAGTYGEIVHLKTLGDHIIILNSVKVAKELLEGRSAIYSDRPNLAMLTLAQLDREMPMRPYGEEWRAQRKILAQSFSHGMLPQYHHIQELEARRLVRGLLQNPDDVVSLAKTRIAAIIMHITYGWTVMGDEDEMVNTGSQGVADFAAASEPGKWLVNLIPLLRFVPRWVPGASFRRIADGWNEFHRAMVPAPYLWCKRQTEAGSLRERCVVGSVLSQIEGELSPEDDATLRCAANSAWGGGLDTNLSTTLTFFLAMLHNPRVQAKAQAEIDSVVGTERLPTIVDRLSLPYVRSVIAEVFRWSPAAPLGLPHSLRQDDVYKDYLLPKSSIIVPNIWYMLHDPAVYPQPDAFLPERYANDDNEMRKVTDLAFGFGRRACPGFFFAERTVFAIVATVLATCTIVPKLDENGDPIMREIEYTSSTIVFPKDVVCDIKPRSLKAIDLLEELLNAQSDEVGTGMTSSQ
ncbi:hypothetical protein FOMPIDRAFT_1161685 [Fomitopsis schrenkii]|uniref:Cytochrome P450 n=1 Tax=Fomitopsis schrenkii TaxID=2126942 RepID=S8E8R4_FOMSC|nr:hypothetical protein FOMPIDRAFT_1161685 [Fomitopsis schrenkii]